MFTHIVNFLLGFVWIDLTTIVVGGIASLLAWRRVFNENRALPAFRRPRALIALTVAVSVDLIAWCPAWFLPNWVNALVAIGLALSTFILVLIALRLGIRERNGARSPVVAATVIIATASVPGLIMICFP
jgi:hypothetical protein